MSKKIFLSSGGFTLVSDEDFIYLVCYTWHQTYNEHVYGYINGKNPFMSRVIAKRMGLDLLNDIDHIDRNPLNNQRSNLRSATRRQNNTNSKGTGKSGFKGVDHYGRRWRARIRVNGEEINLGTFDTPEEAHEAYQEAAIKYHGEFVCFD